MRNTELNLLISKYEDKLSRVGLSLGLPEDIGTVTLLNRFIDDLKKLGGIKNRKPFSRFRMTDTDLIMTVTDKDGNEYDLVAKFPIAKQGK